MELFVKALQEHPELAIFLTLALGFLIGKLKVGTFRLGTVVGTLLAGVIIGQMQIQVPAAVKTVFFDLFLFTVGYKVGPQFFRGLKKDALSQVAVTVVLCVTSLLAAFVASKLLGFDVGTAAGLIAGASLLAQLTGVVALKIFIVGFTACTIPPFVTWALGYHLFKINPAVLMGGVAGARSHSGPCREAAKEIGSSVPWVGFPVGYAVSGVLLTVFGYFAMVLSK